jgi:hypothetical protein
MMKVLNHCMEICSDLVANSVDSESIKNMFKHPKKTFKKLYFKRTDGQWGILKAEIMLLFFNLI